MAEEPEAPEESMKLGLAAAIASGMRINRWAKENGVPKTTAYRWAQDATVRINVEAARRRMLDRMAGTMTRRCAFAASRITQLASDTQSEAMKLKALRTIVATRCASRSTRTVKREWPKKMQDETALVIAAGVLTLALPSCRLSSLQFGAHLIQSG